MAEEKEIEKKKAYLLEYLSGAAVRHQTEQKDSLLYHNYALSEPSGQAVYQSFSDEELLTYLKTLSEKLDHAPSQKEVFWVLRDYIKHRFRRWPYALKAAGLAPSAGKGGKPIQQIKDDNARRSLLLKQVKKKALELGKIPHPGDLPEICEELGRAYSQWSEVIEAADLDSQFLDAEAVYEIADLEPEYEKLLADVKSFAMKIGRSPGRGEIDVQIKRKLIARCGSWRNALYQIGLTPVIKIKPFNGIYIDYRRKDNRAGHTDTVKNCVYKVLNLSEEAEQDLKTLQELYQSTGAVPTKKSVPRELRQRLQLVCGTWVNTLYQIGIMPKEYYQALNAEKTGGKYEREK